MAEEKKPEIILYDLDCTKNICFSPAVWRTRIMLNYKRIPYRTVFLEFPDIAPKLKELGVSPEQVAPGCPPGYTVPVVHHLPSNTYVKDSALIAQFLESTYPDPPLTLTSELGSKIETQGRVAISGVSRMSILPRELNILSPRSQEYFRNKLEPSLGHPVEDLLNEEREEQDWKNADSVIRTTSDLIQTNKADGPFVLGAQPSETDCFLAGYLQCVRVISEEIFQRLNAYPGFKQVYEACLPYMDKKD